MALRRPTLPQLAAVLLVVLTGIGCESAARSLGSDAAEARRQGEDLLTTLAARFGPTERDPVFEAARPKLARSALIPSRVFDDSTVWTASRGDSREIGFVGRSGGSRYQMAVRATPPAPKAPAEYRGDWRLERLRPGEFEWMAREELAVGGVSPTVLSRTLTALFRSAEAEPAGDAAARVRRELPRTAAALGRLLTLDALAVSHDSDGATRVRLTVSMHTARLRPAAPQYVKYLDDVIVPSRFSATAFDDQGTKWWDLAARDARFTMHLRVNGGDLAPLDAPPRPIPARLRVRTALSSKTGAFRTGVHDLDVDVELVRRLEEKGFVARFHKPPNWDLPFLVPLLLRPALRRPFEGDGATLSFAAVAPANEATLLTRHYRVAVKENWILRWIGGFAASAVNQFRRGEAEADRFSAEVLLALRDDVVALIDRPPHP